MLARFAEYDMVLFPCQGAQYTRNTNAQAVVMAYANAGGRIFTTHYSYVWLTNSAGNRRNGRFCSSRTLAFAPSTSATA